MRGTSSLLGATRKEIAMSNRSTYEDPWGNHERSTSNIEGDALPPVELPDRKFSQGGFSFGDIEVAQMFEERVIPRQVPGYDQMRLRALHVGKRFVRSGTSVLDLGSSQGRMLRDLVTLFAVQASKCEDAGGRWLENDKIASVKYLGLDYEEAMVEQAKIITEDTVKNKIAGVSPVDINFIQADLSDGLDVHIKKLSRPASLITSILTVMFIAPEHRPRLLREVYNRLDVGGAFILVEKTLGRSQLEQDLLQSLYHDDKRRNGIDDETIKAKAKAIEKVLIPFTSEGNKELLRNAGFRDSHIIPFWRDLQFEGIVAIK